MLFRKLFRLLVLGGVMVGSATGCGSAAQGQAADDKKPDSRDGGSPDDGGSAKAQDSDAGTAADAGGGVVGW
ncbi:MAG: hypothetical protein E6J64_03885 [Deltaproteobacteria bacterium]|nr:MAG: hypothetical protein E6J64_03885 [Deltaproteobacteria bacterium]